MIRKEYVWTAAGTNIEERWKLHGWVRPSEQLEYQAKWKLYQELPLRNLDALDIVRYEEIMKRNKVVRIK